jgi:hypothetical protein
MFSILTARGLKSVEDFVVARMDREDTFRGGGLCTVVDVLGSWEGAPNLAESSRKMGLADRLRKTFGIGKQQSFVFVQGQIRDESDVRPEVRDPANAPLGPIRTFSA